MLNIEKFNCTACQACQNVCPKKCITLKNDGDGFLYSSIDAEKCTNCNLCEQTCPVLNMKEFSNKPVAIEFFNIQHIN